MKWLEDMNRAMDYIEEHLREDTDYEAIAKKACCSVYHFQRMFTFMTDITLSAYIRRRKMTLAAFDLMNGEKKVIDIAMDYGYDSPESFTRAFKSLHGITPSQVRNGEFSVKAFPRITFQLTIKGVYSMDYKIVKKEAFQVYGIEKVVDSKDDQDLQEVPKFWLDMLRDGSYQKLAKSAGCPSGVNAVCCYEKLEGTKYPYMFCVMKTPLSNTEGYKVIDVPKATWAVFTNEPHDISETSQKVDELTARVYKEWLPTAEIELEQGINFEMYYQDFKGKFYEERWFKVK